MLKNYGKRIYSMAQCQKKILHKTVILSHVGSRIKDLKCKNRDLQINFRFFYFLSQIKISPPKMHGNCLSFWINQLSAPLRLFVRDSKQREIQLLVSVSKSNKSSLETKHLKGLVKVYKMVINTTP